jgi:hypothetical protein
MKKFLFVFFLLNISLSSIAEPITSEADLVKLAGTPEAQTESESERFVNSIKSLAEAKTILRDAMKLLETECSTGGCFDNYQIQICETLAAIDAKIGYRLNIGWESSEKLSDDDLSGIDKDFPVSKQDISLFKLMFSQCKPSNYQYWKHSNVLHVIYSPSSEIDAQVKKYLNVK